MAVSSGRAKRMFDRHERRGRAVPLNLVSLMDIFTILVFFLLVNSSDVQTLPSSKGLEMPESVAETAARETIVLKVTPERILVDGMDVVAVDAARANPAPVLPGLRAALVAQRGPDENAEVTVMADRSLPYSLLRKIMATCADAEFDRVSLAVIQRAAAAAGESG